MRFIPNAKQRKAAQLLDRADMYLRLTYGHKATEMACHILAEAQRFVRCGFNQSLTAEWFGL